MNCKWLVLGVALMSLAAVAFAQHDSMAGAQPAGEAGARPAFDRLKALGGSWEGMLTTVPAVPEAQGKVAQVTLHVSSMGNALQHEVKIEGRPDDPITMFYMDGDDLVLTHYCDAGNRPRMRSRVSPDDKRVEFDLVDVAGSTEHGNMYHSTFTLIDADHHIEDWTWMNPGGQTIQAHFDLRRTK